VSNPSRAKGTKWEVDLLPHLQGLFGPGVDRAPLKGTYDYGDFLNVPWLHEAKSSIKPLFQAWARIAERKAGDAWVVLWKGDLRTKSGNGPYVLMPLKFYELLVEYATWDAISDGERARMIQDDARNYLGGK
jgi:hypothetical protein